MLNISPIKESTYFRTRHVELPGWDSKRSKPNAVQAIPT